MVFEELFKLIKSGEISQNVPTNKGVSPPNGIDLLKIEKISNSAYKLISQIKPEEEQTDSSVVKLLEPMFRAAGHALTTGEFGESFEYLREEANKTAKVTDNMLDTFARGTVRINAFRVAVGKTLGTGEGGGGEERRRGEERRTGCVIQNEYPLNLKVVGINFVVFGCLQ